MGNILSALLRNKRKNESWFKYVMGLLHLWLGLITGVIIVVVSLTGAIYIFKTPVIRWYDSAFVYRDDSADDLASLETVIDNFYQRYEQQPSRIVIPQYQDENLTVQAGRGGSAVVAYADRATGDLVGRGSAGPGKFFSVVLQLHRWLMVRNVGKVVVGVCTLVFIFMLLSGLVLWFPTKKKKVKQSFTLKKKAKTARVIYDLHNVIGFYSTIFLLLLAVTGLCFSFSWFRQGTLHLFKSEADKKVLAISAEQQQDRIDAGMDALFERFMQEQERVTTKAPLSYDESLAVADSLLGYAGQTVVMLPGGRNTTLTIRRDNTNNWLGAQLTDEVTFDVDGHLDRVELFSDKKLFQQVNRLILPMHTGDICGWPSQILFFLLAMISASLPVTGFLIWWKQAKKKLR